MNDGQNSYQVSLRYKFIQVVGADADVDEYDYRSAAATSGFTHSGQNLGPGVEYEINISGSMTHRGGTTNPNALQQKRGHAIQPQTIIFYMYAPLGYPVKKLEFSIKQVLNITEYSSNDVLRQINQV